MSFLKFRAWDKFESKMKEVKCLDFADWWVSTGYKEGERNSFNNELTDRHILMQFTGLKDRKGNEIYEHDIVKITLVDAFGTVVGEEICVVLYDRYSYVFAPSMKHRGLSLDGLFFRYKSAVHVYWKLLSNIYVDDSMLKN